VRHVPNGAPVSESALPLCVAVIFSRSKRGVFGLSRDLHCTAAIRNLASIAFLAILFALTRLPTTTSH
jgi:hypothetical protein